jgi:hypothetical protein
MHSSCILDDLAMGNFNFNFDAGLQFAGACACGRLDRKSTVTLANQAPSFFSLVVVDI